MSHSPGRRQPGSNALENAACLRRRTRNLEGDRIRSLTNPGANPTRRRIAKMHSAPRRATDELFEGAAQGAVSPRLPIVCARVSRQFTERAGDRAGAASV